VFVLQWVCVAVCLSVVLQCVAVAERVYRRLDAVCLCCSVFVLQCVCVAVCLSVVFECVAVAERVYRRLGAV